MLMTILMLNNYIPESLPCPRDSICFPHLGCRRPPASPERVSLGLNIYIYIYIKYKVICFMPDTQSNEAENTQTKPYLVFLT